MTKSHPPAQPQRPSGPTAPTRPTKAASATIAEVLYPVSEVAAMWRCTVQHIYNLISKGELRSVQLGMGRVKTRVPASAMAEFVARRTDKARAA